MINAYSENIISKNLDPPGPDTNIDYDREEIQPPKDNDYDRDTSEGNDRTGNHIDFCSAFF